MRAWRRAAVPSAADFWGRTSSARARNEATDSDAASRVETALTNRYNSIFQQNASYSAENLDMVKNCKVTKDGNFVTMIIGEKASDMLKMFNDSIK